MTSERVVLDTNVFVSGLLSSSSTPARAVDKTITEGQLVGSTATLRALVRTLGSTKFDRNVSRERRDALILRLAPLVDIVEVVQRVRVCRDPDDDRFLEAAVNGRATVVVTGDEDLLALHPFRGIRILEPATYIAS